VGALALETAARSERPIVGRFHMRLFEPGGPTLEDRVLGVWEDLQAHSQADCPVCGEQDQLAADGCSVCGSCLR
jgi:hypothetical protein